MADGHRTMLLKIRARSSHAKQIAEGVELPYMEGRNICNIER